MGLWPPLGDAPWPAFSRQFQNITDGKSARRSPCSSAMGVIGGCAAVALMWWGQAPLLTALERPPGVEAQPGQLIHPLYLQLDTPAHPAPRRR